MTELIITPNYDKKTARFKGTIAGGESVKVTIVGAANWLSDGLRLRVVCGCARTVAMFPLTSEDGAVSSFEVEGEDLIAAPLELNTIQARLHTQGFAATTATFIVEDIEKNILYFQDSYELRGWVKRCGDEEPYDLTKFPGLIEDWARQIENLIVDAEEVDGGIEVTVCDGVSPAKTFIIRNGRDGQPGEPGRKGDDGKSLTFNDLTEAQKAELKGPKGETGEGVTDELKALPDKVAENTQAIETNRVAINTEENRAKDAEKELSTRIEKSKANAAAAMTAASKAQDTADKTVTEIATLVGDDPGDKRKSARQIAAEEVAKVIAGADTNYDTLKEIADYIKGDAIDAAQLKNKVTNLEANKADATALEAEVSRAKGAEAALAWRVTELEENGGGDSSVIVDDALTQDGENPVKSKGIWSAIWGVISAPAVSVYEWVTAELGKKQNALSEAQTAAVNSGITAAKVEKLNGVEAGAQKNPDLSDYAKKSDIPAAPDLSEYAKTAEVLPRYSFVNANFKWVEEFTEATVTIAPYTNAVKGMGNYPNATYTIKVADGDDVYCRDCVLQLEVPAGISAPKLLWGTNFHPRTDAETDFACEVGKRNVYWITEHAPGEFTVAGWQETVGGNAE